MPFDLNAILRVIISPNSAFTQIRDSEEKYFAQSIGLLIVSSVLSAFVILPFAMIPLNDDYVEEIDLPKEGADLVLVSVAGFLKGIVSFIILYFIGKNLGGNTEWKKVFSVFFHTYVPIIPMMIIMSVLVFLMWGSLAEINPSQLMTPEARTSQVLSTIEPLIVFAILIAVFAISFIIWIIIISVKAIKIVNGFETAKAFGLLIIVMIAASAVSLVFGA